MTDYFSPTVVQQILPFACMTSLEKLVLSAVFETEEFEGGLYCFASEAIAETPTLDFAEVRDALKHGSGIASRLHEFVGEEAKKQNANSKWFDLDFSVEGIAFILQDILRRSETLTHISIVTAFTCSKMMSDGFGGMVTLITREEIRGMSTNEILEKWLADAFP